MGYAMTSKFRRFVSAFLVPVVFSWSVLYPAREAKAVIPLVAPIAMSIYGVGGSILAADAFTAAATALVGGVAMAAIFSIGGDNPVQLRIPLQSDQTKTDAAMPPPTAPATSDVITTPPSSPTGYFQLCNVNTSPCTGSVDTFTGCKTWTVNAAAGSYCHATDGTNINYGVGNGLTPWPGTSGCANGYNLVNNVCQLANPRLAVPDNKIDYTRSGSGFTATNDIDNTKGTMSRQMVGNSVQTWGRDYNGNPFVITNGVNANGDTTIKVQRQGISAGGQTLVRTDDFVIAGSNGVVTSGASTTAAGNIGFSTLTGAPVVTQGTAVTPAEAPAINIPTDYNREVTQQGIKDKTAISADKLTHLDDQFKAGDLSPVVPFDPSVMAPLKPDPGQISSWLSTLLSKVGLPAGGQCSNASISSELLGRPVTLSFVGICSSLAPIINWFAWILVVFAVWRGVHRVTVGSSSEFVGAK